MTAAALSTRFAAHHPESIRAVYRMFGQLVYSVSYDVLGEADLAEAATQQTFLQAWTAAGTPTADTALGPWLCTIAHRVSFDLYRRQRHRRQEHIDFALAEPVDDCTPDDRFADSWKLRQALDLLPDKDRELLRLHHRHQLTYTEIADRWDVPVTAVKSRSHRAHRLLAQLLANRRGDPADGQILSSQGRHQPR